MDTRLTQAWVVGEHELPDISLEQRHRPGELEPAPGQVLVLESGRWSVMDRAEFDRLYEWA